MTSTPPPTSHHTSAIPFHRLQSPDRILQKEMEDHQKESLRKAFMQKAFNVQYEEGKPPTEPVVPRTSMMLNQKDYQHRLFVLRNWIQPANQQAQRQHQQNHRSGFKWIKEFEVRQSTNGEYSLYRRPDPEASAFRNAHLMAPRPVCVAEDMFDILYQYHVADNTHMQSEPLYNRLRNHWYGIPLSTVKQFVQVCPGCTKNQNRFHPINGAVMPIRSFQFRDRFQCDLIDMHNSPARLYQGDGDSPICHWCLVLKDHFTRFTMLRPIPHKQANHVARELDFLFSIIGYPMIFQTDNGKEFVANEVYNKIIELNPSCGMIRGRPRTPKDQGSVERTNDTIKRIMARAVHHRRSLCPNPADRQHVSWVTEIPAVMRSINGMRSKGLGNFEPYRMVFGMGMDDPVMQGISTEIASNPSMYATVSSRLGHLEDSFKEKMIAMGELGDNDDQLGSDFDQFWDAWSGYCRSSDIDLLGIGDALSRNPANQLSTEWSHYSTSSSSNPPADSPTPVFQRAFPRTTLAPPGNDIVVTSLQANVPRSQFCFTTTWQQWSSPEPDGGTRGGSWPTNSQTRRTITFGLAF